MERDEEGNKRRERERERTIQETFYQWRKKLILIIYIRYIYIFKESKAKDDKTLFKWNYIAWYGGWSTYLSFSQNEKFSKLF